MKISGIYKSDKSCYWLIPTDNRLQDSMSKIGVNYKYRDLITPYLKAAGKFVYIIYDPIYGDEMMNWGWNRFEGKLIDEYSENKGYEFKGVVNTSELELDSEKYNL
jgi:hypothetical protein